MQYIRTISLGKALWWWLPPLILMGCLYYLSSRPTVPVGETALSNFLFYKSVHVGAYAMLSYLLFRALYLTTGNRYHPGAVFALAAVGAFLWGISDEIRQMQVPGRTPSIHDAAINGIGIAITGVIMYCQRDSIRSILFE
ncbi:MAG: VanZ family protein [Patescibacteria group bacterium]|nr:VanZ family protein [Patescibacteria group bacterium]